jgi:hypothetical protein
MAHYLLDVGFGPSNPVYFIVLNEKWAIYCFHVVILVKESVQYRVSVWAIGQCWDLVC